MAGRGREILLRIVGDGDDARRKLAEVTTDLREFGQLNAEARADIKTQGAEAKLQVLRDRLFRLGQQEANPKVQIKMASTLAQIEAIEAKLDRLDGKSVNVDVDVGRGGAERGAGAVGGLLGLLSNAGSTLARAASQFGNVGGALTSIATAGPAVLAVMAPILLALAAIAGSALAAAAGLGVLAIAFAAVAAPVAILGLVALPRLVAITKALHEQHTKSAASAAAVAAAHDQVRGATEQVAAAQDDLRQQTTAANQAWRDSLEAVKDDLLDIQHAQLGIEQADLRRDQARLRLRQLLRASGVDQGQVQGLTQKAQDINFQQDPGALAKLLRGAGATDVGREKQLEIRQALLDVKDATLGVKDANDRLHDSHVKLADDERTRAEFAKRGIAAYEPYRQATKQLADANRSLASAQRSQAEATRKQGEAMADLSPTERRFAATIELIQKRIKTAFGPALNAVFGGLARGLAAATKSLTDPRVVAGLTRIGRAIGGVFVALGRELARPETRDAFVALANGAARLVRVLGQRAGVDLFRLFLRVALAAMPGLVKLFEDLVGWLDGLERGSRNTDKLKRDVSDLIGTTRGWLSVIIDVSTFLGKMLLAARDLAGAILHPFDESRPMVRALGRALGLTADDMEGLRKAARNIGTALSWLAETIWPGVQQFLRGLARAVRGAIQVITGLLTGDWKKAWNGAKDELAGALSAMRGLLKAVVAPFLAGGKALGRALANGIKSGAAGIVGFFKGIVNGVIGVVNGVIRAVDKIHVKIPKFGPIGGGTIGFNVQPIPELAAGGIAVRDTLARIGEAGREAVIPLRADVLAALGQAIAVATPQMALAGVAGVPGAGGDKHFHAHVTTPDGGAPDERMLLANMDREFRARGLGE